MLEKTFKSEHEDLHHMNIFILGLLGVGLLSAQLCFGRFRLSEHSEWQGGNLGFVIICISCHLKNHFSAR